MISSQDNIQQQLELLADLPDLKNLDFIINNNLDFEKENIEKIFENVEKDISSHDSIFNLDYIKNFKVI